MVDARCYENWLPRVSFHVCRSPPYHVGPILELPQCRVAAEAQYATDPTLLMAVIHMCGRSRQTYAADASLGGDQLVTFRFGHAVLTLQMALPPLDRPACLAACRQAVRRSGVAMPLTVRLDLTTGPAKLVSGRDVHLLAHRLSHCLPAAPVVRGAVLCHALPAPHLKAVTPVLVSRKCSGRKVPLASRALLHARLASHSLSPRHLRSEGKDS